MPFSDPTSVYLDALARKRAQAEALMQNSKEAGAGIVGGLNAAEGLRVRKVAEDRQAAQDAAAAAQQATENERAAEGMRIKKREEDRNAAQARYGVEGDILARQRQQTLDAQARNAAATSDARAAELHGLTIRQTGETAEQAKRENARKAITALPPETMFPGDQSFADVVAKAGEAGGFSREESLAMYRDAQTTRATGEDAAKLEARKTEAEIAKLRRVPQGRAAAPPRPNAPDGAPSAVPGEQLRPNIISDLNQTKTTIGAIDSLRDLKSKVNTGQLLGRIQRGAASAVEQEAFTRFQTMSRLLARQIGKAVEGGRLTDADAREYQKILFNPDSDDAEFLGVLNEVDALTRGQYVSELQALEQAGYAVPEGLRVPGGFASAGLPGGDVQEQFLRKHSLPEPTIKDF